VQVNTYESKSIPIQDVTGLTLADVVNKTCLVGLSYFNLQGELLKQNLITGSVTAVDAEMGITLQLQQKADGSAADFILPANLSCWFSAPKGEFHTSQEGVKVQDPDYLVTWDVHQTKDTTADGEQQWWEWVARTTPPQVGG